METALGEKAHRRGHHVHAEVAAVVIEVVKRVVVIGQVAGLQIEHHRAHFNSGSVIGEDEQV